MIRHEQEDQIRIEDSVRKILHKRNEEYPDRPDELLFKKGIVYEALLTAYCVADGAWPIKIGHEDWTEEKKKEFCFSAVREFAVLPQWIDRASESASILIQFGEVAINELLESIYDEDESVRSFSVNCIEYLLRTDVSTSST